MGQFLRSRSTRPCVSWGFAATTATTSILHPDTAFLVEFPATPLAIGTAPVFRVGAQRIPTGLLKILSYAVLDGQAGGVLSLE